MRGAPGGAPGIVTLPVWKSQTGYPSHPAELTTFIFSIIAARSLGATRVLRCWPAGSPTLSSPITYLWLVVSWVASKEGVLSAEKLGSPGATAGRDTAEPRPAR